MQTPAISSVNKKRRLRWFAIAYFAFLMTLAFPVTPTHSPMFEPVRAEPITDYRAVAREMAKERYSWGDTQFSCLNKLWGKESAWNPKADNPISSAFGIAQMLNETATDAIVQIRNGLRYIEHRYDNPCAAWAFWQRNNWY